MKLGIISDIHGDLDGLRKALDHLDKLGADEIMCAGDMLERGKQGDAVVALIRERGIPCVKGNHEYITISKEALRKERGSVEGLRHLPVTPETLAFVTDLPDSLKLERAGIGILMAHGTPWSDFVYLYPETRENVYQRVAEEARAQGASVVVLGHTHIPLRADVGEVRIVNPGSVYIAGSHSFGLLTLPARDFAVFAVDSGESLEPAQVTC